jgi:hypothetical protein
MDPLCDSDDEDGEIVTEFDDSNCGPCKQIFLMKAEVERLRRVIAQIADHTQNKWPCDVVWTLEKISKFAKATLEGWK